MRRKKTRGRARRTRTAPPPVAAEKAITLVRDRMLRASAILKLKEQAAEIKKIRAALNVELDKLERKNAGLTRRIKRGAKVNYGNMGATE